MEMAKTKSEQGFTRREYDLIQQLVKERMENEQDLQYESFEGYEIPPRTQFSMIKKPAVSIKGSVITFNSACIRLFEGVKYVIPMLNRKRQRFAVVPCSEEEPASIEWAREKNGKWTGKAVTSPDFVNILFKEMGWDGTCRYKILGNLCLSQRGLILVFDLSEAISFTPQKEYVDEETGKTKRRSMKLYADKYRNNIGISYSDYEAAKQMDKLDDLSGYEGADPVLNPSGPESFSIGQKGREKTGDIIMNDETIHEGTGLQLAEVSRSVFMPDPGTKEENLDKNRQEVIFAGQGG